MIKDVTIGLVSIAAVVGAVGLVAADKMPSDVVAAVISAATAYLFAHRETDNVRKSWEQWYADHQKDHHMS